MKKRCLVLLIFVLLICVKGNCQDGVLISNRPHSESQAASDHIRQALEPFVQQVVTNKLIEEIQDVLKRSVEQLGVGLRPELALLASQRATLQSFKQESTLTLIRDSYHEVLDQAVKQYQQGLDQKLIEQSIINLADVRLRALLDDYVFQQIIKMVLEKALTTQQQIMMQAAMQQVVQQKINEVLQEQQEVAKEIQQQYQNSFLVR